MIGGPGGGTSAGSGTRERNLCRGCVVCEHRGRLEGDVVYDGGGVVDTA